MERHNLDILSLFAGIVFVAVALVGLTDAVVLSPSDLRWLGPVAIVGFGIVLVATAGDGRHRDPEPDADPDLDADDETQEIRRDG